MTRHNSGIVQSLALSLALGVFAPASWACSCVQSTLQTWFERSDNVFTAVITGGRVTMNPLLHDGDLEAAFRVTETFKGSVPFDRLRSNVSSSMCGTSFNVGREYLIFSSDRGGVGGCGGTSIVDRKHVQQAGTDMAPHVKLRRWLNGEIPDASEAWRYGELRDTCQLSTMADAADEFGAYHLTLAYRFAAADFERDDPDAARWQAGYAELSVRTPARGRGSLQLRLGDREIQAHWTERKSTTPHFVTSGNPVLEFAAQLPGAGPIEVRLYPEVGKSIESSIPTTFLGTAAADFLNCSKKKRSPRVLGLAAASASFKASKDYESLYVIRSHLQSGMSRGELDQLLGKPDIARYGQRWYRSTKEASNSRPGSKSYLGLAVSFKDHTGNLTDKLHFFWIDDIPDSRD